MLIKEIKKLKDENKCLRDQLEKAENAWFVWEKGFKGSPTVKWFN